MTNLTTDDRATVVDRLRCRYPTGPMVNGKPEFGYRDFSGPAPEGVMLPTPLMLEAADEIERQRKALGALAVDILQRDWEGVLDWAKSVKVTFPNGEPEVSL